MSALVSLLFISVLVSADLMPTAPGPGEIYETGSDCPIEWNVDTSGQWTNVSINLMSGSNSAMSIISNVASGIDGTDPNVTPFTWPCPDVSPNSNIYFYEFHNENHPASSKWTTRFTIASRSGDTAAPENSAQSNGDPIPWGNGQVVDSSENAGSSDSIAAQSMPDVTMPSRTKKSAKTGSPDSASTPDGSDPNANELTTDIPSATATGMKKIKTKAQTSSSAGGTRAEPEPTIRLPPQRAQASGSLSTSPSNSCTRMSSGASFGRGIARPEAWLLFLVFLCVT